MDESKHKKTEFESEIEKIKKELNEIYPEIFDTASLHYKQTFLNLELANNIGGYGYKFFCYELVDEQKKYFTHFVDCFKKIQKRHQKEFVDEWISKIEKEKSSLAELKNSKNEFKKLWITTKEEWIYSNEPNTKVVSYTDRRVVFWDDKIEKLINFYITNLEDKEPVEPKTLNDKKKKFYWNGQIKELVELIRALKLSEKISNEKGDIITNKQICELFENLEVKRRNNQPITEKDILDYPNKNRYKEKFFPYELDKILIDEHN